MAVIRCGDAETGGQMRLAGGGSAIDRLQHLRDVLPCEVRVTSASHPLFGHLLAAHHFRRVDGVVFLVVDLPDGSPGTVRVDATDVLGVGVSEPVVTVLDGEGLRVLQALVARLPTRGCPASEAGDDK